MVKSAQLDLMQGQMHAEAYQIRLLEAIYKCIAKVRPEDCWSGVDSLMCSFLPFDPYPLS